MRLQIALATMSVASALALAGAAQAAVSAEVQDAVIRVTVIPESRDDIKVEIISRNPQLPLTVRTSGARVIIDGDLDRKIRSCEGRGEAARVVVRGIGVIAWHDMPQVVIRTPRAVNLDAGGAVWGSVGRSASLKLGNAGCGDWTVANVDGEMRISQAGSGGARIGSAGQASIRIAGSGDATVGEVRGPLSVDIAGSGDVQVASVNGALEVHTAGSGDVRIAGGRATTMVAAVAGSGNVDFRGEAGSLKARVAGSGDIHVDAVAGAVSKSVMGSGQISVGR